MHRRVLVIALLLTSSGCGFEACARNNTTKRDIADDLPRLSRELALPLPKETVVEWAQREEGMDDMTRAKLTMSVADFARLAPNLPLKPEDLTPGAGQLGPSHQGWNPDATPGMRSGQAQLDGGRFLNFGYATLGDRVTLFVMNFGT